MVGDNYAGELAKDPIRKAGIGYELAQKHKSELYVAFLPVLNAGKVLLPRHDRAVTQICSLERSLLKTGREQISCPPHGSDDIANAIAGAVDLVYSQVGYDRLYRAWDPNWIDPDRPTPAAGQLEQPQCNGDWWKSMPRSQPTFSADERLRGFYQSLDLSCKSGFSR